MADAESATLQKIFDTSQFFFRSEKHPVSIPHLRSVISVSVLMIHHVRQAVSCYILQRGQTLAVIHGGLHAVCQRYIPTHRIPTYTYIYSSAHADAPCAIAAQFTGIGDGRGHYRSQCCNIFYPLPLSRNRHRIHYRLTIIIYQTITRYIIIIPQIVIP